jgi:hypothetical protein
MLTARFAVPLLKGTGGSIVTVSHAAALNGVAGTSTLAAI